MKLQLRNDGKIRWKEDAFFQLGGSCEGSPDRVNFDKNLVDVYAYTLKTINLNNLTP